MTNTKKIILSNSLGRKKEVFKPIMSGAVSIYTCGPTVYNYAHIGNHRANVFADILKRMFLFNKYKVKHVMNITDVGHLTSDADEGEDKMEKGASREGKTVWEIARFYEEAFKTDLTKLNIINPDIFSRATEHIQEMIDMDKKLEEKGFTYIGEGNLYFDTSKFDNYWELIGKEQKEEDQRARVTHDEHKKNKADFVLWFTRHKHGNHAMEWDSPWGRGFPGWHIECSAMSTKYLGDRFDIHTGGIDHIPIHHTNEIAQNDCTYSHKVVNYWMHNEFLVIKDSKMAKSGENFITLKTLEDKGYSALDYRYFLLLTHYKKKLMFSYEGLDAAKTALSRLKNKVVELRKDKSVYDNEKYNLIVDEFNEFVNDDLNTSKGIGLLWDTFSNNSISSCTKLKIAEKFDEIFGLDLMKEESYVIPDKVKLLAEERLKARNTKDWTKSDELRDKISKLGYQVLDTKEGYDIKPK